jgi:hypothetical protein
MEAICKNAGSRKYAGCGNLYFDAFFSYVSYGLDFTDKHDLAILLCLYLSGLVYPVVIDWVSRKKKHQVSQLAK